MPQVGDAVDRVLGRLYTNFILRDLTFFVSGGIVIVFAVNKPFEEIGDIFALNENFVWIIIPAFLAVSYVLGVLLQEAARLIILERASERYIDKRSNELLKSKAYDRRETLVVKMERLIKEGHSEYTRNGVERILFLKQIAATQFSAIGAVIILLVLRFLGNTALLLRHPFQFLGSGLLIYIKISILLVGMGLCFWMYRYKAHQQERVISGLMALAEGN